MDKQSDLNETDKIVMGCIGVAIGGPVLIMISALSGGVATQLLWNWFMVPILGLPYLSFWAAYAISLVISFMTGPSYDGETPDGYTPFQAFIYTCTKPILRAGFFVLFGMIARAFLGL